MSDEQYSDEQYIVFESTAGWMIKFKAEENGPYKSLAEAMLFAIDAAIELGHFGLSAEVCRIDAQGRVHTEWTYARRKRRAQFPDPFALPLSECAAVLANAATQRG